MWITAVLWGYSLLFIRRLCVIGLEGGSSPHLGQRRCELFARWLGVLHIWGSFAVSYLLVDWEFSTFGVASL